MHWFVRTCTLFLLLNSSVGASEIDRQEPEQPRHIKVTNDDELIKCFKDINPSVPAPNIKRLHIAYEISPILLNGLLPESESFVQPQLKALELLSFKYKQKFLGKRIRVVPLQHISNNLKYITSLDLSHTQLTDNPFTEPSDITPLATMPLLKTLILRDTGLGRFLDFRKFRTLTELDVSHNKFIDNEHYPPCPDFSNLSTLTIFNISNSNIDYFYEGFSYLSNLIELNVEYNYRLSLPSLAPLIKLRKLNIADTKNFRSDELASLSALRNLEVINLSGNVVFARNFVQLLKMESLKTIHMSQSYTDDEYVELAGKYIKVSDLIRQTTKKIIISEPTKGQLEDAERRASYDVTGLVTTEDFIEYDRLWSQRPW